MGRTMAVVLFTDLVGSTELRGRLGEEAADELRRRHDQLLTEAVESNDGRVVKGLGDGIMATFAGASDAVVAAVAIQQAIDRLNRSGKTPVPISVRVGVSAGDASFEDGDVHGTPVIEASRLCAAVGGGEILVAEVVRLLIGTADHHLVDRGRLELKGLQTPVSAWEVRWEPTAVSGLPMPALLTDVGRIFVGRHTELEKLGQLWKEAAAGERRVALIAGEPGVGKTRLATEIAGQVHAEGAVVLAGRCDEDLGVPYQPFVEALGRYVDHAPDVRVGRLGGELLRLVPELAERVADLPPPLESDAETERYRLFEAVAAWLGAAAAEEPVLLVLDDLQWAAKPTLLLLRHVVRSADARRLLVLGIYRDTELPHGHPLVEVLADLRSHPDVERLSLAGLDSSAVAAFMEQAADHAMGDEELALARAIYEETEGNPFFIREILRHLADTGAIEGSDGRWVSRLPVEELGIPEGVREVVGRRLSRLSTQANQALRMAAVVGLEFEVPVVGAACGLDEDGLLASLEETTRARLTIEGDAGQRCRFAHALVRDTLYAELSTAHRVTLHRRVAEAIEDVHADRLDDHLPALAHHWGQASAGTAHATRAALYAVRAGDRALAQLAHDEAVSYYRQALDLVDTAEEPADETWRIDLLIALGEAEHRSGQPGYRAALQEAAQQAERLGDPDRLARAALAGHRSVWDKNLPDQGTGRLTGLGGEFPYAAALTGDTERLRVLEAAIRARSDRKDAIRARLLAMLAGELMFTADRQRRHELSDEALALARHLDDPTTLARVLHSRCSAIWDPAMLEERRTNAAELRAVAADLGDPFAKVWASMYSFETAMEAAEVAEADGHLDSAQRAATEVERALLWLAAFPRVGRVLLAGRVQEADVLARETLEIGLATQPLEDVRIHYGMQRFQIRFEQGRLDELVAKLAHTRVYAEQPETRAMLAQAYCELGRWHEARAVFETLAPSLPGLSLDPNWILTMTRSAAVCAQLGDTATAAVLHELLVPYAERIAGQGVIWTGCVAHYLGLLATVLGNLATAEAHFAQAEVIHERIGAPTWLARTRVEWARMLLRREQPDDGPRARELLDQALATARELGLANVERRAVELLE